MNMNALSLGRSASGRCANTFLSQSFFIHDRIHAMSLPEDLKSRIIKAGSMLHGSYFDINTENEEMDQLFNEGTRWRAIHLRLVRLHEWLQTDMLALGQLNQELSARIADDPAIANAYYLMITASTTVMKSYIALGEVVQALPAFESLPVETVTNPDSFPAVNAPYAPLCAEDKAFAAELQAIVDAPYEPLK